MTRIQADTHALAAELVALLRLTRSEAQIARIRVSQARDEATRRELLDNAEEADLRAIRLQEALRHLGGTPDVVGDAVGRVLALGKATAEQLQPFSEGLLGDLALEHQLRDRVVFARVLAEALDEPTVAGLMRDLETAHTETIEWIRLRLAELAQGGPVALAPTPPQTAASALARWAVLPARTGATIVNRAADLLSRGRARLHRSADAAVSEVQEVAATARERVQDAAEATRDRVEHAAEATRDRVEETVETLQRTAEATAEVAAAGRDAALARAEEVAPSATVRDAAHEARETLGTVAPGDLPIAGYDILSASLAARRVAELDDAEDVRLVLRYEQAHKNRKVVVSAAERHVTRLAEKALDA